MPLSAEQFRRAEAVFAAALDLPVERQFGFINDVFRDEPDLAKQVLDLLAQDRDAPVGKRGLTHAVQRAARGGSSGELLLSESSLFDGAPLDASAGPPDGTPRQIGPYRLIERLGEGGFGTVWRAEQSSPVRREVALKILKSEVASAQIIARFEAERQALAIMDHPNIARVYDAGTTPDRRPFFVMEIVSGVPITHFCDATRRTIRERLELFIPVCEAVQHAHQKGIIHRDLKPGNILVATHDGRPVPKIIDFGIAKATLRPLLERTIVTEARQLVGTPDYMSPEQADLDCADIDTRSDVYSLGVVLYELLTGTLPFDRDELRGSGIETMLRTIREREPPRPSTRVGTLGAGPAENRGPDALAPPDAGLTSLPGRASSTEIARDRRTDAQALRRQLRGDLDWVVMKALEKDRARRYASPADLAADVRRHLRSEPVAAGPPGTLYRLQKFARRHRGAVAACVAVGFTLVAGLIASTIGFVEARRERDAARAAQQRTQEQQRLTASEAAKARAASQFITDLFGSMHPSRSRGREITVREVFAQADAKLASEPVREQPEIEAAIRHTLAQTYHMLGWREAAETQFRAALTLRRATFKNDHGDLAEGLHSLGAFLTNWGDRQEAIDRLDEALAMRRRLGLYEDPVTAELLHSLARASSSDVGRYEELMMLAYEMRVRLLGTAHESVADSLSDLAYLDASRGESRRAIDRHAEAVSIYRTAIGDGHPKMAGMLYSMGDLLCNLGHLAEAEPYYLEAARTYAAVFGVGNESLARCWNSLGVARLERHLVREAEAPLRAAIAALDAAPEVEYRFEAVLLGNLGGCLQMLGRLDEAEELLQRSRAMLGVEPDDEFFPTAEFRLNLLWQDRFAMDRGELPRCGAPETD